MSEEIVSHVTDALKAAKTMNELVQAGAVIQPLKVGEVVSGKVINAGKNEVWVSIPGIGVGVARGMEMYSDKGSTSLKPGDEVFASIIEVENSDGNVELSLRQAGQEQVWQVLREKMETSEIIPTKIISANKGGLMVEVNGVSGFLPVSQLSLEHYPRVEEGDKTKILEVLQGFVNKTFSVQIITANQEEEKLIVSEKAVHEKETEEKLSKLKLGDVVHGKVTGIVDFGVFVKFGELEGLVHISELAWQRVEKPKNFVKIGQEVDAKIIAIEKGRVSLSIKQLQVDPWLDAVKKYQIGQAVKGKISKIVPYGVFVELDENIQGLAHLLELSHEAIKNPEDVLKVGEEKEFKIISIDPANYRLGLSLKALEEKSTEKKTE